MTFHILAIGIGLLLDRLIGDPPGWPHPVRWIGRYIMLMEKKLNKGRQAFRNGFILTGSLMSLVFLVVFGIVACAYSVHPFSGIAVEALLIASGLAQKSLKVAAEEVYQPLINKDLEIAREKLSWIVGRDTDHLEESEITRGVVETVSENTSDGITAPLFWAFLLGAPGLWLYKAVNTCDSMVGYKNEKFEHFGFASAKLDDLLNFIPSRITGLLILLLTKNRQTMTLGERLKLWFTDAPKHPSPNSGWLEAATAVQMGIQLGGVNSYNGVSSYRAVMGEPIHKLEALHIKEAVTHMQIATWAFFILFSLGGILLGLT
ncbi:adenosylcobinamide-phosphate synthase CbiB [Planomicrobium okeanokoites]|uniref:Cobalamin biosynthesis protein CobD n=1 Tax=Planomicrobium okeanokoites TaxID=244 RepID=A0ABV7KMA3_PLAOK|nr:adenosylcobinamide-phosphate synthase CbiB [Planomicrobium okeanokoites]TAA68242.1 cobalamin biosynthesis protein CobD [Planomicrobium okeanokoites]